MTRRFSKFGLVAAAVGVLTAGAAYASPVSIYLVSGSATHSQQAPSGSNTIGFSSSNFGGWDVTYANGTSGSPSASPNSINGGLDLGTLSAACLNEAGCQALTITVSDTGFTTPTNDFTLIGSNDQKNGQGMVQQTGWVKGNVIGTMTLTNSQTKTLVGGGIPTSMPYSLTLTDVLTPVCSNGVTTCNASFSFDGSITTVPEPGTLALFGAGLLGFALLMRRRRARQE